jgi:hypothetical protein
MNQVRIFVDGFIDCASRKLLHSSGFLFRQFHQFVIPVLSRIPVTRVAGRPPFRTCEDSLSCNGLIAGDYAVTRFLRTPVFLGRPPSRPFNCEARALR